MLQRWRERIGARDDFSAPSRAAAKAVVTRQGGHWPLFALAAQHRLERLPRDRTRLKREVTHLTILGLVPLTVALILATHLTVGEIVGNRFANALSPTVGAVIVVTWWWLPLRHRGGGR